MVSNTKARKQDTRKRMRRHVPAYCLSVLLWSGCATTEPASRGRSGASDLGVDPSKALLTLAEIRPDPPAPVGSPEGVPGLSESGVRRLARAQELYRAQRYTEAGTELEKALRQEPDHPVLHRELALAARGAGNQQRVRTELNRALELNPDDVVTHYLLGRLAFDDGQTLLAVERFRVALKTSNVDAYPSFKALCHFHLAKALNAEGYLVSAIEQYRAYETAAAAIPPDADVDPELAALREINGGRAGQPISVAYEKLGRYDEAADALADAIDDRPSDASTREHLARLLTEAGRLDEALKQARALLEESEQALNLLADIHRRAGHPEGVIDDARSLHLKDPDKVDWLIAYADALERFGRTADAETVLRDAVRRLPDQESLYWRLADVLSALGRWRDMLDALAAAVRENPSAHETARNKLLTRLTDATAAGALLESADGPGAIQLDDATAYLLGVLAQKMGREELAERLLRRAIDLKPEFAPARLTLAELLLSRFAWREVIDLATADAGALNQSSHLQRLCGIAYAGLDDFASAEEHLNASVRLNRTDTQAMVALAEAFLESGDIRAAMRQYEDVVEANPLHEEAREVLVEIYVRGEKRDDAVKQLAELRRLSADPHRIARCAALVERGPATENTDWKAYREALERAVAEFGPDAKTYTRIAVCYTYQGSPDDCLKTAEQSLALDPKLTEALEQKVVAHEQRLEFGQAIDGLKTLLSRHPNRGRWSDRLWQLLMYEQKFDEAYGEALRQLKEMNREGEEKLRSQARAIDALQGAKRHDNLIALLRQWLDEDEADSPFWGPMVSAFLGADRLDEAVAFARRWRERQPQKEDAREAVLLTLFRAKRFEEAQQLILDVLEADPSDQELQLKLVDALRRAERYDDALELVENLAQESADKWTWRNAKLFVLDKARRYSEALELLDAYLLELTSDEDQQNADLVRQIQSRIAVDLILSRQYDEAAKKLRTWIDQAEQPRVRFIYLRTLAQCFQNQAKPDEAIQALDEASELTKRDPTLLRDGVRVSSMQRDGVLVGLNNDLGYTLADAGRRLDEAERMIRYAVARTPDNGAYLDSLGWVLYKKGRFEQAKGWLEKAVNLDTGQDPVVFDHLGDVNWRLGLPDDATRRWKEAVELIQKEPDDAERPDWSELLGKVRQKIEAIENGQEPITAPWVTPEPAETGAAK